MRIKLILPLSGIATMTIAVPAYAHAGQHDHMSMLELVQHFAEPDHLAFLALTVVVGWLVFRWGRRVEVRQSTVTPKSKQDCQ